MVNNSGDRPYVGPIGSVIRERRKALGLTQLEVADLAGCHNDFVSDLERGKKTVRLDKMQDVLEVLGLRLRVVDRGV